MSAGNQDIMFEDVDMLQQVAKTMANRAQDMKQGIPVPQTNTAPPTAPITPVTIPPTAPVLTREQLAMGKYNDDKKKLTQVNQQLLNLSHADKCGEIVRNFGMSQLVLHVGDTIDRTNGLVLLRALKSQAHAKRRERCSTEKEKVTEIISSNEKIVTHLYEVWGLMEDGSIGLTACYAPSIVFCVLSLMSGLDLPPDFEED